MKEIEVGMMDDSNQFQEIHHSNVKYIAEPLNESVDIIDDLSELLSFFPEDLGELDIKARWIIGLNPGDTR